MQFNIRSLISPEFPSRQKLSLASKNNYQNSLLATLIGVGCLCLAIHLTGGNISHFVHLPSLLIVIGGSFAACVVQFGIPALSQTWNTTKRCMLVRDQAQQGQIQNLILIAKRSKQSGRIQVLEQEANRTDDGFFKLACECAADNHSSDELKRILQVEAQISRSRWLHSADVLEALGTYCPAFGLIGTVVGLISMLSSFGTTGALGPAMSTALMTTLYGALTAHLVFLPLAGKVRGASEHDRLFKEFVIEAMVSITREESPVLLEQRLVSFSNASFGVA